MASNPGELLISGFQTGLNIRRNVEETAKLVREREQQEQADKDMQDAMKELEPMRQQLIFKRAKYMDMLRQQNAGGAVDQVQKGVLEQELRDLSMNQIHFTEQLGFQLAGSSNPLTQAKAQQLLQSAYSMTAQMGDSVQKAKEAEDVNTRQAAQIQSTEGIAARGEASSTERTQIQAKTSQANTAAEQAGALQRTRIQAATDIQTTGQREAGATERNTATLQSGEQTAKAERELRANQFQQEFDLKRSQIQTPAKQMEDILGMGKGIYALRALGWSDKDIDAHLPKGFTAEQFDSIYGQIGQDQADKLRKAEAQVTRLEKRLKAGDKVQDEYKRAKEYVAQLRKSEDQRNDAEIQWEQFKLDHTSAEAAGAEFGRTLQGAGESLVDSVASPYHWLRGAVAGPQLRKTEKEARAQSIKTPQP